MSSLSQLLKTESADPNDPASSAGPSGKAAGVAGSKSPALNKLRQVAAGNPRAVYAGAGAGAVVLAAFALIVLHHREHAAAVRLAPVMTPSKSAGKVAPMILRAPGPGASAAGHAATPQASTPSTASAPKLLVPIVHVPASAASQAAGEQDAAKTLFEKASQGAVHLATIDKVQPGLYAVAYRVGGKSGQAWVDVGSKVVFLGQAVGADGKVLTPSGVAFAQAAAKPVAEASQPAAREAGPMSAAQAAVVSDTRAGFWRGSARAPDKIWAFVDPDSKTSMEFFEEVKPLVRAGQLRVYWIPVGTYDSQSAERAAYILAQVGPYHQLDLNYQGFTLHGNHGAASVNTQSAAMSMRVMQNNTLLTNLGKLELPAVLTCTPEGSVKTLYNPSIETLVNSFGPCSKAVLAVADLSN